jgi:hypothetical protein
MRTGISSLATMEIVARHNRDVGDHARRVVGGA